MIARSFLAALALSITIHAQELAPLSAKYKTDSDAVAARRDASIARIVRTYTAALDAAEKSATTAGDVNALSAISSERDSINAKRLLPTAAATLPKSVLPARKTYLVEFAKVDTESGQQNKLVSTSYLQALASLQSRSAGNPSLLAEIAAEKKRVIEAIPVDVPSLAKKIGGTEWANDPGSHAFTLNTDGSAKSSSGSKGKWSLGSPTELILQWSGNPKESWTLDAAAGTLKKSGHSYSRKN